MTGKSAKKQAAKPPRKNYTLTIGIVIVVIAVSFGLIMFSSSKSNSRDQVNTSRPDKTSTADGATEPARLVEYEVVNSYPHDREAFLQGLIWHGGSLYESTGLNGRSTLRHIEFPSGKIVKSVKLSPEFFGEGLALVGNRLFQLTWHARRGFIYDLDTFNLLGEFTYDGEGWGLTYDGTHLIMSNGSDALTYLNVENFKPTRKLSVTMNGRPVRQLNELEFIEGEIWANVWQRDIILRINPATGRVTSYLDMKGLMPQEMRAGGEDVLNGIAYDAERKRIFVSGKLWPRIFEIRLKTT